MGDCIDGTESIPALLKTIHIEGGRVELKVGYARAYKGVIKGATQAVDCIAENGSRFSIITCTWVLLCGGSGWMVVSTLIRFIYLKNGNPSPGAIMFEDLGSELYHQMRAYDNRPINSGPLILLFCELPLMFNLITIGHPKRHSVDVVFILALLQHMPDFAPS